MTLPKYQTYAASRVEWLRRLPSHWGGLPLKHACDVIPSNVDKKTYEGESTVRLCNYTDVYYNDVIRGDMPFMTASASDEQVRKFTLRAGDVLVTKDSETADDIAVAAYVPEDLPGVVCGYHLAVIRPKVGVIGSYVKRLFDSHYLKASFAVRANGLTRVGLSQDALANVFIPVPPDEEQAAISAFLDRETAKIDALIAEQEKLIALLAEKRQATISHAVTRGLNPNVPTKDSGVPWLGEVPAHWEIRRLKNISPEITVGIVVEPSKYYVPEGVPALRSLNVSSGRVSKQKLVYISKEANETLAKSRLRAGDLVSVRSGQTGVTAVVPDDLDGCNCIDLIIIRKPLNGSERFLCWFLASNCAISQFAQGSGGAIQQHFNIGTAMNLLVCVPPSIEQTEIATFLDLEAEKLAALEKEAHRSIALLRERRSALITAAVTGQIDVRGLVSHEDLEPEALAA